MVLRNNSTLGVVLEKKNETALKNDRIPVRF